MTSEPLRVIGYVRVSTNKQEVGPAAQRMRLQMEADNQHWSLDIRQEHAASATTMENRPVLQKALVDLREHRADMLAVSKLDRLSRSVLDFARILDDSATEGWKLACLDLGVDTYTSTGRFVANMFANFAQMERDRISERTREGMAALKAQGHHMGRPYKMPPESIARAIELNGLDLTLEEICDQLTEERMPTSGGGRWQPGTVANLLDRAGVTRRRYKHHRAYKRRHAVS